MSRPSAFALLTVGLALVLACGGVPVTEPAPASDEPSAAAGAPATHRLLGVVDPERDMVAFAFKIPVGWETAQSFTRTWDGAIPTAQITLRLRAPDGSAQIEWLPLSQYTWSEGPQTDALRRSSRELGVSPQIYPNELRPRAASAWVTDVLLPELARNGIAVSNVHGARDAPEEQPSPGVIVRRGSVDGTLPDGQRVRVEGRLRLNVSVLSGERYTSWSAVPSITRTRGDLEAAHAQTRTAQDSIVQNPAWVAIEGEAQRRGAEASSEASRRAHEATMDQIRRNTEQMTAGHQQRMDDIARQGAANTAAYEERMDRMDREQEVRVDTIRGVEKMQDPNTGERVKVEAGHDAAYRSNPGGDIGSSTILLTDGPIDPSRVDWQELQRVTQAEY